MKEAGVLLAISSLPSAYGVGDFGPSAERFLHDLKKAGFKLWQILPLNPVGYGNSPYQPYSSFAIDELYLSLDWLKEKGWIRKLRLFHPTASSVDYEAVRAFKEPYLKEAFENFKPDAGYRRFIQQPWLQDYALYRALKKRNQDRPWMEWPERYESQIEKEGALQEEIAYQSFLQYVLDCQWRQLRKKASKLGIQLMGDLPFYVGQDSADVWAHQESFLLNKDGYPRFIAGVPPDFFSATGQRWGNPIYDWEALKQDHYRFLIDRIAHAAQQVDCLRIDHFRAFDTYWKIPAECLTAVEGEWMEADGYVFFDTLFVSYPKLSIVVEDLGLLRDEVFQLRDHYQFKGMKILQFSYDRCRAVDQEKDREKLIVYPGTHDNETLRGWMASFSRKEKKQAVCFLQERGCIQSTMNRSWIDYLLKSEAETAIFAMQDLLELDQRARMNVPGTINQKNWCWKMSSWDRFEQDLSFWKQRIRAAGR